MKQIFEAHFPAPAEVVVRMFSDRQFYCSRLEQQGHDVYEVLNCNEAPHDFSIRFRRKIPILSSGVLKKMAPAEMHIEHEDFWNARTRKGRVLVHMQGLPLDLSCETELVDAGDSCRVVYHWLIQSKVPVVGKAIEKSVAAEYAKAMPEQARAGIALLDRYR